MRSNYKKIGPYIREVVEKNSDLAVKLLLGVSVSKEFIPSIANIIGTDMSTYKIVRKNQFAYGPVTSRNSDKVSIAMLNVDECIVSTSYTVFEIIDHDTLLPEYLMMWFRRPEFDRYARFKSHGSVRELFDWEEMCDVELPMPSIEKQREIVKEYHTIVDRIKLNERLNQKLEETAQAIYKQWFVDFEFPISAEYAAAIGEPELEGQPYKSSGGEMVFNEVLKQEIPKGWKLSTLGFEINYSKGFAFKSSDYKSCGIPIVRVSNFDGNTIDIENCNCIDESQCGAYEKFRLNQFDIIISTVGSWPNNPDSVVGKVVMVPMLARGSLLNQNAVRLRAVRKIQQFFIYYALANEKFAGYVITGAQGSANQASVTLEHLFGFNLILPDSSLEEFLYNVLSKLYNLKTSLENELFNLSKLERLILSGMAQKGTS